MKNKIKIVFAVLPLFFLIALPVLATTGNGASTTSGPPEVLQGGPETAKDLIGDRLTKYALGIAGTIAVIMIIASGFLMMTAGGNKERYQKGVKMLVSSIVGLIIVILAYVIIYVIAQAVAG